MSGPAPTAPDLATAIPAGSAGIDAKQPVNVLVVGVGGQGVIMVSKLIALLAQQQGYEVKQSEVHGMAKRGGAVFSHVRFGKLVWSPTIPKGEADFLVALEWAEGLRWLDYLRPGSGVFICDTKQIVPPFSCRDRRPGDGSAIRLRANRQRLVQPLVAPDRLEQLHPRPHHPDPPPQARPRRQHRAGGARSDRHNRPGVSRGGARSTRHTTTPTPTTGGARSGPVPVGPDQP